MKNRDLLNALNDIDTDMLEDAYSARKPFGGKIWIKWASAAACLCIVAATAITLIPYLNRPTPPIYSEQSSSGEESSSFETPPVVKPPIGDETPVGNETAPPKSTGSQVTDSIIPEESVPTFNATLSPDKLSGSSLEFIVGSNASVSGGESACPPEFKFESSSIVVQASFVKSLPDTYFKLSTSSTHKPTAYRLIEFKTDAVINGKNIPDRFLYLIPEYVFVDFSLYDTFLISMSQMGLENFVLRNSSQNKIEALSMPIFHDYQDHPELGNIIAFSDGIFDEGLWQNRSWIYGYQFAKYDLDESSKRLVVSRGCSLEYTLNKINFEINEYGYSSPEYISFTPKTEKGIAIMEYVAPFTNGVFAQSGFSSDIVIYRRFINGCETDQTISINLTTEEVSYSGSRYSDEDMESLDDIAAIISEKASEYADNIPQPPHTDPEGKTLICFNLYGWYVKVGDDVYGIIKTVWIYTEEDNWFVQYYDDSYSIYCSKKNIARKISRDELITLIDHRNVYHGEYGVPHEMPM